MSEGQPVATIHTVALLRNTGTIVAAYVSKNAVPVSDIAGMIRSVHNALTGAAGGMASDHGATAKPAVPIKKSITADYLVCLEDGKHCKTLKRYLRSRYQLTPDEYRTKWGLPRDYPMVAPNYAERRSQLAKQSGLGRKRIARQTKKRVARR
jgi:predicted transcriptional regulator